MENKTAEYICYATEINQMKFIWKLKQIKNYILKDNLEEIEKILPFV